MFKNVEDLQQQIIQKAFEVLFQGIREIDAFKEQNRQTPISVAFQNFPKQEDEMSYYYKQGSVSKRKDGRYVARIYLFGKQRQVAISRIKKEVIDKLNEVIELKEQRKVTSMEELNLYLKNPFTLKKHFEANAPQAFKLHEWLDLWIQTYKSPKVSARYLSLMKSVIKVHIKPNLPNIPLDELSALQIQQAMNAIKFSRTKESFYAILHESAQKALDLGFCEKNFMRGVERHIHRRTPRKAFTSEQQEMFVKTASTMPFGALYLFQLYSGARPGEALRMKWSFLDYKNNTIFIDGTKNVYAKRTIPFFQKLKDVLSTVPKENEKIFPIGHNEAAQRFNDILKAANLSGFDQYCLRHTFCTRLSQIGIDIKTIAAIVGHNDTRTTEQFYIENQSEHINLMKSKIDGKL